MPNLLARVFAALIFSVLAPLATALDADHFSRVIDQGLADWGIPGMAVVVIEDAEVVFEQGYGVASLASGAAVDRDTLFVNASTTKAMVAAAMLLLVDEERVALDAPVLDYLPGLRFADPALTAQVTVRDLLTHRTGLPSTDFWTFNQGMALADQVPRLVEVDAVAAPRSRFIYQNTMYELAGQVIAAAAGEPWHEFLARRLWRPIGMDATFANQGAIGADHVHADAHGEVDGELRTIDHSLRPEVTDAAGSVWSSVADMARWAQFLLADGVTASGERLLSEAAIEEMFAPQQLIAADDFNRYAALAEPAWRSYGLGWFQQDFQGRKIDFHTGSLNGAVAMLGLDRSGGRAVVVMANREAAELRHALLWEVMDGRAAGQREDWSALVLAVFEARQAERDAAWETLAAGRIADLPPSLSLSDYTGEFDSPRSGPLWVELEADGLVLRTRVRSYRLTPWHADTFLVMHKDWNRGDFARFALAPDGGIDGVEVFGDAFAAGDD